MNPTTKLVLRAESAVILALVIVPVVIGQGRQSDRARDHDLRGSDFDLMQLDKEPKSPTGRQASRIAFTQAADNFKHLQMVNNKMMQAVVRGDALDLGFVTESASEIRKYADRLKDNLVLPEPEYDPRRSKVAVASGTEQLRSSLSALGELVAEFASNPIFRGANAVDVIDVQQSAKARRDLDEIIELSSQIKKSSEKLKRTAQTLNGKTVN
jgi:hypothetical protein